MWKMLQTSLALSWESRKPFHTQLSLQAAGRYRLHSAEPLRHWDLAAGIGISVLSTLRAGLTYTPGGYYHTCEVNEVALGVLRGNLRAIGDVYPSRAPKQSVFNEFDNVLPDDLFVLAQRAREILKQLPAEQLPNYISSSVPCTETSKAGRPRRRREHGEREALPLRHHYYLGSGNGVQGTRPG